VPAFFITRLQDAIGFIPAHAKVCFSDSFSEILIGPLVRLTSILVEPFFLDQRGPLFLPLEPDIDRRYSSKTPDEDVPGNRFQDSHQAERGRNHDENSRHGRVHSRSGEQVHQEATDRPEQSEIDVGDRHGALRIMLDENGSLSSSATAVHPDIAIPEMEN